MSAYTHLKAHILYPSYLQQDRDEDSEEEDSDESDDDDDDNVFAVNTVINISENQVGATILLLVLVTLSLYVPHVSMSVPLNIFQVFKIY